MKIAVLFDVDGVLVDSVALNWAAKNAVFKSYGFQVNDDQIVKYLGQSLEDQIAAVAADNETDIDFESFQKELSEVLPGFMKELKPQPGVTELLKSLKRNNAAIVAATSLPRHLMENKFSITGLMQYFDDFVTADDVERHKPDPEVFSEAAEKTGLPSSSCVVFEDAPAGVEAGKSGGFSVIAVKTPYVEDVKLTDADLVVSSLEDVDYEQLVSLLESKN